jgi:hypothetical protein
MAISTSVKTFRYDMVGAPVLNGVAGSMIGVLDACLVNGFGLVTVNSISVSNGIATASVSSGHGFEEYSVVLISGASPATLNGEKRVLSRTANTFTFDAAGISNQSATGTISAKVAPAGWEKVFSGTNLAVYRSKDPEGTRMYLRVDDTNANSARVVGYESMSDVNTGVNPFPTTSQVSGGLYWAKASDTSTQARGWEIFADSRTFYTKVSTHTITNISGGIPHGFGDFNSEKSSDAYACFINGAVSSLHITGDNRPEGLNFCRTSPSDASLYQYLTRSYTGIGGSVPSIRRSQFPVSNDSYSGSSDGSHLAYPNGPNNGLVVCKTFIFQDGPHLRGSLRGFFFVPQKIPMSGFSPKTTVDGQGEFQGRKLAAVTSNAFNRTEANSINFVDVTGPWS